jgi:4'-phosphopantetheinyl transferase
MFIDVWPISLCEGHLTAVEAEAILSPEERQRAARFYFPEHRLRFRLCHAAVRQILSSYLDSSPSELQFVCESNGKPQLVGYPRLCFNLSHSGDLALLAVADGLQVGVDVEAVRLHLPVDELARFFTDSEREKLLATADGEARARLFFRWWTRKEAVLKADGSGLSGGLNRLDISNCPPDVVRFPAEGAWWRIEDLEVPPGYSGALAAPPGPWEIRWRTGLAT